MITGNHVSYSRAEVRITPRVSTRRTAIAVLALFCMGLLAVCAAPGVSAQQANYLQAGYPYGSTVVARNTVSLLARPATSSARVGSMPANARATVLGGPYSGGWYLVVYGRVRGYVSAGSLAPLASSSTLPPATQPTPAQPAPVEVASPVLPAIPVVPVPPVALPVAPPVSAPPLGLYSGLWMGELSRSSAVRSGPSAVSPVRKTWWAGRRVLLYETAADGKGGLWYRVSEAPELSMWVQATSIRPVAPVQFEQARFPGKWVNVNLAQQVVTAYQDGAPVKVTLASTGVALHPTPPGVWRIYSRLTSQEMRGGSPATHDAYDLPNVPWVQYFQSAGDALHGTYWHDDFGHPHSHGCVNLSTPIAQWFFGWAGNGTVVYVH
ncbi:MAG: L,D-transpeptidase family protein [Chloroflexota bacterium]|nr:L,D-transpeptidase family protein [Chloroflexota bacterium]